MSMEVISINSSFSSVKPKEFQVDFVNVPEKYSLDDDLVCTYTKNSYTAQEGDRIAIFKLGWKFIKEYVVFEWAPTTTDGIITVTFSKTTLPKDTEMYQFCYITHENEILGVSSLFQFYGTNTEEQHLRVDSTTNKTEVAKSTPETLAVCNKKLCCQLKEENLILREALRSLVLGEKYTNESKEDIKELKMTMKNLKDALTRQQNEISMLKQVILNSKESTKLNGDNSESAAVFKGDDNFEFGELQSIPPFPFAK